MPPIPDLPYRATLGAASCRAAELFGDKDFIVMPDRRATFAEVEAASRHLARRMVGAGLGKGSRVGIFYTYGPEFVVAWLAALRIGALVMPFSTIYRPAELRTVLRIGDIDTLLAPPTLLGRAMVPFLEEAVPEVRAAQGRRLFVPELPYLRQIWITGDVERPWVRAVDLDPSSPLDVALPDELLDRLEDEVVPADLAQVTYTSGSAAEPKGVVHSHGGIVRTTSPEAAVGTLSSFGSDTRPLLCGFPFFWIGGTLVLGGALQIGRTVCCLERFEAEAALDLVEAEHIEVIAAWPSLTQSMRSHPTFPGRDVSYNLHLTQNPSEVAAMATAPIPGIPPHRGMSETVGSWNGVDRKVVDPDTGDAQPDLVEGELCVRGFGLMQGYYKREREETFDPDGWLHTGDRVFLYENRPFFVGRFFEMIKSQGANVSPREVEMLLETFPEVAHALVFGMPHPDREEEVTAVLVGVPGTTIDVEDVRARLRRDLSSFKVPTRIEVVADEDDVPWLASGKPDKRALRQRLLDDA